MSAESVFWVCVTIMVIFTGGSPDLIDGIYIYLTK